MLVKEITMDGEMGPEDERHWVLDMPDGLTVEALAASLAAEAEAVTAMAEASVWVRRGETGEWREITAEDRRARGL
jgi:hypothetical protein